MTKVDKNIDALVAAADALEKALVLIKNTYPYDPPCHDWQEKSDAHRAAKQAVLEYRAAREAARKGTPPAYATSA